MGKSNKESVPIAEQLGKLAKKAAKEVIHEDDVDTPILDAKVEKKEKKDKKKREREEDGEVMEESSKRSKVVDESTEKEAEKEKKEKKDKKDKSAKREEVFEEEKKVEKSKKDNKADSCISKTASAGKCIMMSQLEAEEYFESNFVNIEGSTLTEFRPVATFPNAGFHADLLKYTSRFPTPTPIQAVTFAIQLAGRDLIGLAKTGSGKTLSFSLPFLQKIILEGVNTIEPRHPRVLVIAPTRELAIQSQDVLLDVGSAIGIHSVGIIGGEENKREQLDKLRKRVHVIVCTPGRLLGFIRHGDIYLDKVHSLVLDEADRMLDMGFEEDMREIIGKTDAGKRQTIMFSATWPDSVQGLAREFLKSNAVKISIGSTSLEANKQISQTVEVMDPYNKKERMIQVIKEFRKAPGGKDKKILVFGLYKLEAARLEDELNRVFGKECGVCGVHGDKTQGARTEALEQFKRGDVKIMVATDVAGRGLDIPEVELVLIVTFPLTIHDYIHRIGRTARGGRNGISITFVTAKEKHLMGALVDVLRGANQNVPKPLLDLAGVKEGDMGPADARATKKKKHDLYGEHFKDVDMNLKGTKTVFSDSD